MPHYAAFYLCLNCLPKYALSSHQYTKVKHDMDQSHFFLFDSLRPSQQFVSYVGTGLLGLNQYLARINVSCSRT